MALTLIKLIFKLLKSSERTLVIMFVVFLATRCLEWETSYPALVAEIVGLVIILLRRYIDDISQEVEDES